MLPPPFGLWLRRVRERRGGTRENLREAGRTIIAIMFRRMRCDIRFSDGAPLVLPKDIIFDYRMTARIYLASC